MRRLAFCLTLFAASVCLAAEKPVVKSQPWGSTAAGEKVTLFTLRNARGMEARVTNFGAILLACLLFPSYPADDVYLVEVGRGVLVT